MGGASASTASDTERDSDEERAVDLGLDTVFDALRNARRRRVLQYLNEQNGRVTLSDLAEHIAAIENDTTPEALDSQQRKRVYVGLYQSHLPKLDSMGVLTFDRQRGHIERTPAASQLDEYLYDDEADTRSSKRHYVEFLGVSALVLLLGVVTGIVGGIGAAFSFVGLSLGVAGLAAFHAYEQG
ncbi:hypothetical protein HWV23_11135 [Natronomonas halophila]|uniref:DUF7344 domain-containing protein n=1 Tax=Natronomonas halophila TaxID=2747817 RepID=UPI0015B6FAFF|nr:hypothetical protein [Natronomonas halophila]QLD86251.1 hypothetical protein HWV23_11135 [Natronomonas halophila]